MVRFYGAMFREGDVWICMEVMDISLDKFYKMNSDKKGFLPEMFCAKVALSVLPLFLLCGSFKVIVHCQCG